MTTSVEKYQARRVITGIDDQGRSRVVSDQLSSTRAATPTFTVVDLWQTDRVPASVNADNTLTDTVVLQPPQGGALVRLVTFPPDSEWQQNGDYQEALAAISGTDSQTAEEETPGMHVTDTVDVITVVSGEVYAVLENDEILLRAGDSLVQRGTKHAWSNRTNTPATIVATMYSAER